MVVGFLRAAVKQIVKFFVTDWTQTGITVGILVLAVLAARLTSTGAVGYLLTCLLTAQLVYATLGDANRRRAARRRGA